MMAQISFCKQMIASSCESITSETEEPGGGLCAKETSIISRSEALLTVVQQEIKEGFGKIGRSMEAVAEGNYELRKANDELHHLAVNGFLNFVRSVDPSDFCYFVFILVHGDQSKAARALKKPARRFYEEVESWKTRGPVYKRMFDLVWCRKKAMRKGTIPLNASLQSGGVQIGAENPETLGLVFEQIQATVNWTRVTIRKCCKIFSMHWPT